MLLEAQSRSWSLFYMEIKDLFLKNGQAFARTRTLEVTPDPASWYQFSDDKEMPLADLNVILMRKDPPFNQDYIYSTYLLELAEKVAPILSTDHNHYAMPMKSFTPPGFHTVARTCW